MKKIFFIGISGIGMSGLAKIMIDRGYEVSGSDMQIKKSTNELIELGAKFYNVHREENVKGSDLVVRSSAIKKDNPEYKYALENDIKVIKRGELLAILLNDQQGIAIAGTHGKTTTSSMLGASMLSINPTIVVGGILPEIDSNAKAGGKYFIAEADESDNSFLYLTPKYSVITNMEPDHLENHGSFENILKSFEEFIVKTEKEVVLNIDCKSSKQFLNKYKEKIITYSIKEKADIYALNIEINDALTSFEVVINEKNIGKFILSVPGMHNVSNALTVIYLALKFGVSKEELQKKLLSFKGAKRRYDIIYDKNLKIIDDYAHHPTEIEATLKAAKSIEKKEIIAIFQPHRYSRLAFLADDFAKSLTGFKSYILPVYSAGEQDEFGTSIYDLADKIKGATVLKDYTELEELVKEDKVYLMMGAGDISSMAYKLKEKLEGKN